MNKYKMGHLEVILRPSYIWNARFLKVKLPLELFVYNMTNN